MRKEDRFCPVITIVVYYGEEQWDGPVALSDMMETMPEEILRELRVFPGITAVELQRDGRGILCSSDGECASGERAVGDQDGLRVPARGGREEELVRSVHPHALRKLCPEALRELVAVSGPPEYQALTFWG